MDHMTRIYRKNEKIAWRIVEDDGVLLNLSTGYYYTLNEVGRFLWETLDGKKPLSDILTDIIGCYDVDTETAKSDMITLIEDLLQEGLIVADDSIEKDDSASPAP